MRRRPYRTLIAIFLLAWIAVDLAAIDTCVIDVLEAAGGPGCTVALRVPGGPHRPISVHPDDCLCHGHTIAPGTPAGLAAPDLIDTPVEAAGCASPHDMSSALYHPPQLIRRNLVSRKM